MLDEVGAYFAVVKALAQAADRVVWARRFLET
jgi:hypothetical protein